MMTTKRILLWAVLAGCLAVAVPRVPAAEVPMGSLIDELKSSDEEAVLRTVDQLAARGSSAAAAVGPLVELLDASSFRVRKRAAHALGAIGEPAEPALPRLVALLADASPDVRRQAFRAVQRIRPGKKVILPLMAELFEDPDPGVRVRTMHVLAEAGPRAVPTLNELLQRESTAYWACLVAGEIGSEAKECIPAILKLLADTRPKVRRAALLALASMGEAALPARAEIAAALEDPHTAAAATFALGQVGPPLPDAEPTIRRNADGDDALLSTISLWTLARWRPDDLSLRGKAGRLLVERLKDEDPRVREAAGRALAALPPAPEIVTPIWEDIFHDADDATLCHAIAALARLGPEAVPLLAKGLRHEQPRKHILHALRQMGPAAAPATEALAELLDDPNERVVHEAVLALAGIGPPAQHAVPMLLQALQHSSPANAPAIVYALGRIGPGAGAAQAALLERLDHSDDNVALMAAWALVQVAPRSKDLAAKTVPILVAGLASELSIVRQGAAEALGDLGPLAKSAVAPLRKASLDADKDVRTAAENALTAIER